MGSCKYLFVVAGVFLSLNTFAASLENRRQAKRLYERMTGVKVSATKPELKTVADLLEQGNKSEAAKFITSTPDFLNVQIKNLSLRLSNKDESVKVPFNDFSALIVGIVRDNKDFREALTADYFYDVTGVANEADKRTRYFNQNNYIPVEANYLDLSKALVYREQQQMVVVTQDTPALQSEKSYDLMTTAAQVDAAGVLTTRTFAERNLSGGSNRRAVEFSLKQFLCVSMAEAGDSSASDQYVGKDVERFPAGDYNKYVTSCKSCHSVMDGMRGAFAKMDYSNFTNYSGSSFYSQMHGEFFKKQGIASNFASYVADFATPTLINVIPDLEINQANSIFYKTRYDFLISRGATEAAAKTALNNILNTIRDPKIADELIADFRLKKMAVLSDIRAKRTTLEYEATYVKTCLNFLVNTALTAQVQEERFLLCNLNSKRDLSLIYAHYGETLTLVATAEIEKKRLLNKLINLGRPGNNDLVVSYLQAKEQSKFFPRNSFDSETGVALKMNKGTFAYGFAVTSDSFVNNANLGSKATFFGWRGAYKYGGNGVKGFGRMVSESRRFSQCMAKRVYENVCLKKLDSTQYTTMVRLGDRFEALNYNLKSLYAEISLDPVCGIVGED